MCSRKGQDGAVLSVMEAVEALESISELDFGREIDLASEEEIQAQNRQVILKAAKWTRKEGFREAVDLIRKTFHVVLQHLQTFYKKPSLTPGSTMEEGAKTIMLLVGDVAQKLDRFTTLFKGTNAKSVKALREYKQLQNFYLNRIARKIDETVLGKWIFELSQGVFSTWVAGEKTEERRPISTKHVFIDLESVKNDTEYELFFLRKEDGSRFFSPRLIRNIKLVCDFGVSIKGDRLPDPLTDIRVWQDHALHVAAKEILHSVRSCVDTYCRTAAPAYRGELVAELNKALFALLLASAPENLSRNTPVKSCGEYFVDFHYFLRSALLCREYQRAIVYPPKKSEKILLGSIDFLHRLCFGLFTGIRGYNELSAALERVFQENLQQQSTEHEKAIKQTQTLWNALASHQNAFKKFSKQHPNGHLEKVLSILDEDLSQAFDPIAQSHLPYQLYSLYLKDERMISLHLPSPVHQTNIQKAVPVEEFKAFLRFLEEKNLRPHLFINLQDRASWKEHARSVALEDLEESYPSLCVITLPKDTEFYHQEAPYHQDHQTATFLQHFSEHLLDEACGFFFSPKVRSVLSPEWLDKLMKGIHHVFFSQMNVLPVQARCDFIEIVYLFLQLKVLEIVQPGTFSFSCKDAIDIGGLASAQLYAFLRVLQHEGLVKADVDHLDYMIYTAPLLIRERPILQNRFDRMLQVIKRVESVQTEEGFAVLKEKLQKELSPLYKTDILFSTSLVPNI